MIPKGIIIRIYYRGYAQIPKQPTVKWYYNSVSPLSKPEWYEYASEAGEEKFIPFSEYDNSRLEKAYLNKQKSVDVKDDRLFKVHLDSMEISSIYWPGPVYEVRRGTWFTSDGAPIGPETAGIIEEGYLKIKPYEFDTELSGIKKIPRDLVANFNRDLAKERSGAESGEGLEKSSEQAVDIEKESDVIDLGNGLAAIYFDEMYGAIFPKELSAFQVNIIRTLKPSYGSLMSVVPIQRGYTEGIDSSVVDSVKAAKVSSLTQILQNEVASLFSKSSDERGHEDDTDEKKSSILNRVMEVDYNDGQSELDSRRKIKHLVFCVHGIGQLLGGKYESVNFTHSINVMRATMRNVFMNEKKYQQLAHGEQYDEKNDAQKSNNTIQVLPISWRHQVKFHPQKPFKSDKKDLPSLSQLNIDGVRPLRNVIGDVALDVLLFYEPEYLKQILSAVLSEINRVYKLYMEQNPDFDGKIHLFGHSLGSAICFDLLSQQNNEHTSEYNLDFDVQNFFCVGLPIGMFKLLQQKSIKPRVDMNENSISIEDDYFAPKCKNIYNIFHPCDPVSYRLEPLVDIGFANVKPEEVPFALQGFNTQVQNLTSLSDDIQEKIRLALSWFSRDENDKGASQKSRKPGADEENALGDIISTLTSSKAQRSSSKNYKTQVYDEKALQKLLKMNRTGRIDYSLPMGVFSIAIVSALSAHISYFEDQETAGFVMKEILSSEEAPITSRKVVSFG